MSDHFHNWSDMDYFCPVMDFVDDIMLDISITIRKLGAIWGETGKIPHMAVNSVPALVSTYR